MNSHIRTDRNYAKRVYMRYKWIAKHEHYSKSASINADHIEQVYPEFAQIPEGEIKAFHQDDPLRIFY